MLSSSVNPGLLDGYMDPQVLKKGMDEIKEQMREVQKEAHAIESEMEGRFTDMVSRREAKLRGIPNSLTEELTQAQGNLSKGLQDGYVRTRELV